jgi:hypothetical protein
MADSHVISALREKRAKVSGCIARLERQLDQHRADLSHIDGVLRLFEPDRDLEAIKPKRTCAERTRYLARNELSRLCRESLRDGERLSTDARPKEAKECEVIIIGNLRPRRSTIGPAASRFLPYPVDLSQAPICLFNSVSCRSRKREASANYCL